MLIGYARVSTQDQTLHLQQDALQKAGCNRIFTDTASGVKAERKGLEQAFTYVRKGDTLVVWRLDRLGRSLPHLITTITDLEERGIGFKSLTENIDTTTSGGKLIFHIFGALAEFERNLIRERTQAGLTAARARGKKAADQKC
jgi:DNA invertase Pin-like site-specific DNA recombinase